jgi:hypothetical protein
MVQQFYWEESIKDLLYKERQLYLEKLKKNLNIDENASKEFMSILQEMKRVH